ncbi:endogenous retrovirus group S71 member 1 Env polyprotein-like [Trichosurus vulpecula]|uniref:endogenous retrovirus group S71 member 1 Env polyprotein-like n=1 Tax=Trichosurus vulpecula TaxID=9337 RepID=UPI00186B0BEB|nr:endogenous retrovirus group S71 member 1 Env polyprotein-like [Trichosurus vulpecula]
MPVLRPSERKTGRDAVAGAKLYLGNYYREQIVLHFPKSQSHTSPPRYPFPQPGPFGAPPADVGYLLCSTSGCPTTCACPCVTAYNLPLTDPIGSLCIPAGSIGGSDPLLRIHTIESDPWHPKLDLKVQDPVDSAWRATVSQVLGLIIPRDIVELAHMEETVALTVAKMPSPGPRPIDPIGDLAIPDPLVNLAIPVPTPITQEPHTYQVPLLALLSAVQKTLESSNHMLGKNCWICVMPQPPYYVGVALNASITPTSNTEDCQWNQPRLTFGDVQGTGLCLTSSNTTLSSSQHGFICKQTQEIQASSSDYFLAPPGAWWAHHDHLTQCVSATVFLRHQQHPESPLCILVAIIPQVSLLPGEEGWHYFSLEGQLSYRQRRAILLLIPILVGLGLVGSAATGTAALVKGDLSYKALSAQVNTDLSHIKQFISVLEKQVDSLAEVVLQNCRGLDLLFLKQGGLCAALREACCFYANNSGVVRESLRLVRQNIANRQRKLENSENWCQSLFCTSPCLTTLVLALAGPLLLLIIALVVGPCLINRFLQFVKSRINSVKLLLVSDLHYRFANSSPPDSCNGSPENVSRN